MNISNQFRSLFKNVNISTTKKKIQLYEQKYLFERKFERLLKSRCQRKFYKDIKKVYVSNFYREFVRESLVSIVERR